MTQKYVIERNGRYYNGLFYSGPVFGHFGYLWNENINHVCAYSKEEAERVIKDDIRLPNCNLIHVPTPVKRPQKPIQRRLL